MTGTIIPPVVVLDAAGIVGRGLVGAALAAGRPVVAVDSDSALGALDTAGCGAWSRGSELTLLPGTATDDPSAQALAQALRGLGRPLGGVIAPLRTHALRGRLLDVPAAEACRQFDAALEPQLAAARHLLPLLAEAGRGGGYVLVGGPGGDHPWAGYGHGSVVEAALRMLARVLHCEARAVGVRLQLLSVDTPAWGVHAAMPRPDWPSALDIGARALQLLDAPTHDGAVVPYAPGAPGPGSARPPGASDLDAARALLRAASDSPSPTRPLFSASARTLPP